LVDASLNLKICDLGLARTHDQTVSKLNSQPKAQIADNLVKTRRERKKGKRRLSNHIASRWYRSPEVILLDKHYDGGVDLWSAGCIMAEMLTCDKEYRKLGVDPSTRYLFKGTSCFPLSPGGNGKKSKEMD